MTTARSAYASRRIAALLLLSLIAPIAAEAGDAVELKGTTIKGSKEEKELPTITYLVPWTDVKNSNRDGYKIELDNLFRDLFEPVLSRQESVTATGVSATALATE